MSDNEPNGMWKFKKEIYPRLLNLAYYAGVSARMNGLTKSCNLKESHHCSPSGNVLKDYKEAWEQGWVDGLEMLKDNASN